VSFLQNILWLPKGRSLPSAVVGSATGSIWTSNALYAAFWAYATLTDRPDLITIMFHKIDGGFTYILGLWYRLRRLLLPRDTQTPGHRWFHYGPTWQCLASAKTLSLHQAQDIHLSCAVGSVIWLWNVDNAQSRQWQDSVFSYADTASYPWYQMVWQTIHRSSQWENETTGPTVSYCWQTSFIIWSHMSPTGEHTCFANTATATVNRSAAVSEWVRCMMGLVFEGVKLTLWDDVGFRLALEYMPR